MNITSTDMTGQTYNGWANYETWNVALRIQNSEVLYHLAQQWAEHGYKSLSHQLIELCGAETGDGVAWNDPALDINELNEMLEEL